MNLRESLFSEPNSDFLWKACLDEHLPNEKIYIVSKIAGYVLLGFLHPEDVAQEIRESTGIDIKTAEAIQEALNKRIFSPLRADIDKVYSPLSKLEPLPGAPGLKDIRGVDTQPKMTSKPAVLSDVGWSRSSSAGPGIQLSAVPAASGSTHTPPPAPVPPAPPSSKEPAPVMLHEDTSFKAAEKNSGFTLSRPGAGADAHIQGGPVVPAPPKPAVLEFGGVPKPPAAIKQNNTPQSGAVHYSDFKVSLSTMPTVNSGPRNVDQVVPPPPVPMPAATTAPLPTPPTPSAIPVPRPPQAPQAPKPPQSNKPIVKDFL